MNLNIIISIVVLVAGLVYALMIIRKSPERDHKKTISFLRRRALKDARSQINVVALFSADSGCDEIAEVIAKKIRKKLKYVYFNGIGGSYLTNADMVDIGVSKYSSVGYGGAIGWFFIFLKLMFKVNSIIDEETPQSVVLFSNPGINMQIAKRAHQRGIPVIYIFPPETWAYEVLFLTRRTNKAVLKYVDQLYVDFKFEKAYWNQLKKELGGKTKIRYLGQPFLDNIPTKLIKNVENNGYRKKLRADFVGTNGARWVIGLLPGSRLREIKTHLPIMLGAAAKIVKDTKHKDPIKFLLPIAEERFDSVVRGIVKHFTSREELQVEFFKPGKRHEAILVCDLLLASSGTANIEAAYFGIPSVVVYKATLLDRMLVYAGIVKLKEQYVSLANILVEHTIDPKPSQAVCPEIIRGVTPNKIAIEAMNILGDPELLRQKQEILLNASRSVRHNPSAAGKIATEIVELIRSSS